MTFDLFSQPARSRRTDPATSRDAAAGLRRLTTRHAAVWECLRIIGPAADWQVEERYDYFVGDTWWVPQTNQSIRSRRAMLCRYGLVVCTGQRIPTGNGTMAYTWAAVNPERAATLFREVVG